MNVLLIIFSVGIVVLWLATIVYMKMGAFQKPTKSTAGSSEAVPEPHANADTMETQVSDTSSCGSRWPTGAELGVAPLDAPGPRQWQRAGRMDTAEGVPPEENAAKRYNGLSVPSQNQTQVGSAEVKRQDCEVVGWGWREESASTTLRSTSLSSGCSSSPRPLENATTVESEARRGLEEWRGIFPMSP